MSKEKICPSLLKENYKYALTGDVVKNCQCAILEKLCIGIDIVDDENRSSNFFSRSRCKINNDKMKTCKFFGLSKELHIEIIKDIALKELNKKLNKIK